MKSLTVIVICRLANRLLIRPQTAPDAAHAAELAAVEIVGRHADQSCDLLAADAASSGKSAISVQANKGRRSAWK
jgi:hypothetical protein